MKHLVTVAALSMLTAGVGRAADQQTQAFLGIFAETSVMKMAGVSIPKIELPPGVKLPPQAEAAMKSMGGAPQRKLTVRLWSPGIAPDGAAASLAIPDGLKLGPKLDLELYRPKPAEGAGGGGGGQPGAPSIDEFIIKRYWGSSETVKAGQPDIFEFKGLTDDQKAMMRQKQAQMRSSGTSYFYKPDWTTGYWPTPTSPGVVTDEAALTGHYALTTSYTGNVAIDVPDNVNFLAPIEMSSPSLDQVVPLDKAMLFKWKNVPNALGFHATVTGFIQDKKTMIIWTSSELKPEFGMSMDYLQMSEVRDFVGKQIFMAGDRVDVAVPAGIFDGCDFVSMQMVGYGPGTALENGQPLPRVQSKTTLMINLGGTKMPKPGGRRGGFGRPGAADPNAGQ